MRKFSQMKPNRVYRMFMTSTFARLRRMPESVKPS